MIPGLTYIPNFISEKEESELLSTIDSQTWLTDLKRKTQHYGYKYDYTKKSIDDSLKLGPLPDWLQSYSTRLKYIFGQDIDQVIVNDYQPGQGISRHVDCVPCFGPIIASLSLKSPCIMQFESFSQEKDQILLESRSLLVLTKQARYDWMHSIPHRKEDKVGDEVIKRSRRASLTFRTIIKNENIV